MKTRKLNESEKNGLVFKYLRLVVSEKKRSEQQYKG